MRWSRISAACKSPLIERLITDIHGRWSLNSQKRYLMFRTSSGRNTWASKATITLFGQHSFWHPFRPWWPVAFKELSFSLCHSRCLSFVKTEHFKIQRLPLITWMGGEKESFYTLVCTFIHKIIAAEDLQPSKITTTWPKKWSFWLVSITYGKRLQTPTKEKGRL
jgi:hypothetical protein